MTMLVSLHFNAFLASQVKPTAYSTYYRKREHHHNVVYVKTEPKPFTLNTYLWHFLSALHSRLTQEMHV